MKLGETQPLKPYKFLQEEILEGVWPLSKFKSPINIFLLIVIYVLWGFALFIIYPIPDYYVIAGSISAIGISIWTFGIVTYANSLRNVDIEELNIASKRLLSNFMEDMFHNSSLFYGIVLSMVSYVIISSSSIIRDDPFLNPILGNFHLLLQVTERTSLIDGLKNAMNVGSIPLPILLYIYFISFDICYRVGLSFHILLMQAKRNWNIYRYLSKESDRSKVERNEINNIQRSDIFHYIALAGGIFLLPIVAVDILFLLSLIGVVVFVFVTATFNIVSLRLIINKFFD